MVQNVNFRRARLQARRQSLRADVGNGSQNTPQVCYIAAPVRSSQEHYAFDRIEAFTIYCIVFMCENQGLLHTLVIERSLGKVSDLLENNSTKAVTDKYNWANVLTIWMSTKGRRPERIYYVLSTWSWISRTELRSPRANSSTRDSDLLNSTREG